MSYLVKIRDHSDYPSALVWPLTNVRGRAEDLSIIAEKI